MSRYVDIEPYEEYALQRYYRNSMGECVETVPLCGLPTADVAEVRHGEWVFKFYCGNMSGYDYGMKCSVCGKPTYRQFAEKMPPFCPNCGASMVNEDE